MLYLLLFTVNSSTASESFDGRTFYLGDLHVHTGSSGDGCSTDHGNICDKDTEGAGSTEDLFTNAIANNLDFLAVTDHINGPHELSSIRDFYTVFQQVLDGHDPANGFLTIPAVELAFLYADGSPLGHRNLYMFAGNEVLEDFWLPEAQYNGQQSEIGSCDEVWLYMDKMTEKYGPSLLLPHHTTAKKLMQGDWGCSHEEYAPAVEVYSEHGNSMRLHPAYDALLGDSSYQTWTSVHDALTPSQFDLKLGFYAATDNHKTMPGGVCFNRFGYAGGLAVVVLDSSAEFDRMSIMDALVERRTYATSGPLLPVTATYFSGGKIVGEMGDEITLTQHSDLQAVVKVPVELSAMITEVQLVGIVDAELDVPIWFELPMETHEDGVFVYDFADGIPALFYPMLVVDGEAWWGANGCDDGGKDDSERIWLSPVWISMAPFREAGSPFATTPDTTTTDTSLTSTETHTDGEEETSTAPTPDDSESTGCRCDNVSGPSTLWWISLLLGLFKYRKHALHPVWFH